MSPLCTYMVVVLQIFLTANPKLRSEVAKQFHKLRAAILRDSAESKRLEELSNQDYPSLADIPTDAFPLFWTTKQYLRAVDATLPDTPLRDGPFFPRSASAFLVLHKGLISFKWCLSQLCILYIAYISQHLTVTETYTSMVW